MDINDWRRKIDEIDLEILKLLNERAKTVLEIGKEKTQKGIDYYVPEREIAILERITDFNKGPFSNEALRKIYREILSASLSLEHPLRISYLGPAGTFTHQASIMKFGNSPRFIPAKNIAEVFNNVEKEFCDFGVVPVENSTEGAVNYTLDMLIDSDLKICHEIYMEIAHYLLSTGSRLEEITTLYSHPQALAQCRLWIEENLPSATTVEVSSTSLAVEKALQDVSSAAIGSRLAADLYGIKILKSRIEDNVSNITRFLAMGKKMPAPTGKDKTSIIFSVKDCSGALFKALEPFAGGNINLTKIESRPTKRRPWEYVFFVDFEGYYKDVHVINALEKLRDKCVFIKILGSYMCA